MAPDSPSPSRTEHTPGWGVSLRGARADLTAWRNVLNPPFDPWIEVVDRPGSDTEYVLRSLEFDALASATEVAAAGRHFIERLNGALSLGQAEEPVQPGPILKFKPDGKIDRTMFAQAQIRLRGITLTATGVAIGKDGELPPPPPPQPSDPQRWATAALSDPDIADLLMHLGRSNGDWYEIYKTLEVARHISKKHGGFKRIVQDQSEAVENMRHTANTFRHARGAASGAPPKNPTSLDDAGPLLRWIVRGVLDVALPR